METNQVRKGRRCARPIIYVAIALGLFVSPVLAQSRGETSAKVTTDKPDYAPGETVIITGTGWWPGETVVMVLHEEPTTHPDRMLTSVADAEGNFTNRDFTVEEHHLGVTFTLIATGQSSGLTAQTTFTDGNIRIFAGPSGTTFTLTATTYTTTDCTGTGSTPSNCNPTCTVGSTTGTSQTFGVGSAESVKLQAAATSDQGGAFINWTSTSLFTDLGSGAICVQGFTGGATRGYTANYATVVCGNGVVEGSEQCDDGNTANGDCCSSTCQFEAVGSACTSDGNDCTNDVCNGSGTCTHPNKPAGSACGSSSDTDCDNPDTCNGSGVCQSNNEPSGTACTSDGNDCTNDVCNGSGTCTHPNKPAGSACGSSSDTDCDNPDTCDGKGVCQPNHKLDGTACTDDGKACTRDICSGGQCTHPLQPAGTPCHPGDNCPANEACTGSSEECPKPDADGDGVRDKCDFCPTTPTNVCLNLATVSAALFSISISSGSSSEMLEAAQADNLGLLVTDFALNQVIVYRGKGDGTFQRFRTYTVGDGPISLRIGDVNGDGKTDWIAANYLSSTLTVGFGQGDGTFTRLSHIFLIGGKNPSSLAVADFNRDGRLDAAVANFGSNNVTILLGQDNGQLAEVFNVPISGSGPSAIVTADFDRDGVLDLAVANLLSNDVSLLKGNGRGWFGETQRIPVREGPVALATDDFNRDGRPDLAAASFAGDTVSLLLSQPRALTFARTDVSVGQGPIAVVTGEFVPGTLSLATANFSANNVSVVLVEDVRPLRNSQSVRTLANPTSLTVGDVNADGRLDIVVVGSPFPEVLTLLNAGNGTFTPKR
jgi:cysteine-rich repeat protein